MSLLEDMATRAGHFAATLVSPESILALPQLAVSLAIAFAFLALRQRRRRGSLHVRALLRAMMRRRIVFHRSTYADLVYFVINTFVTSGLIGWGLVSSAAIGHWVSAALDSAFGTRAQIHASDWSLRAGITLIAFLAYEAAYYFDHYLMHKIPFLWEIHKTHHSAEVLTPLTVYRVHPIESLIFVDLVALFVGAAQGLFVYAAGRDVGIYALGTTNVIMVAFFFLLAQLQHTQFWIPLSGFAGRILLSPAHHQIHHSIDKAHHNRNLGSFLAIWDWIFGSLHLPQKNSPRLTFGVHQRAADPHSLETLVVAPLVDSVAALRSVTPGLQSADILRLLKWPIVPGPTQ